MADSNYDILRNYFGGQSSTGASTGDIAKFIALNARPKDFSGQKAGSGKPSVMGRIFDILSRPNYAVAELTRERLETGDTDLSAFLAGLTGKKKTTFKDVLKEGGVENSTVRGALGFVLDVGLDPTTYIPVAGIANKLKGVAKGGNVVEDLTKPTQASLLDDGQKIPEGLSGTPRESERLLDILPKTGEVKPGSAPVGQLQFELDVVPTATKKPGKASVEIPKGPSGARQLPLKFPDFNVAKERAKVAKQAELADNLAQRAPSQIARLEAGAIDAAAKLVPLPPPKVTPKQQMIADSILQKWNPSAAKGQLNKTHPNTLNAKQQAKLYHMAAAEAVGMTYKKGRTAPVGKLVQEQTIKIYSAIERGLVDQGFIPRIGTGENVKLSDVLAEHVLQGKTITDSTLREFASDIKPGSDVWKAVETLRARGAVQDAPAVKNVVDKVSETSTAVKTSGVLSQADQKTLDDFLKKFSKKAVEIAGASPAAGKTTGQLVQMALNSGKSAAQLALDARSKMLDDVIAGGKNRVQVNNIVTKALEKDLGKLPSWAVNDNKALEFLMGRVATWWGQADLRPLSLMAIGASHATAATRGKVLDDLFKPYNEAQRHEAWKVIQGSAQASTPEVAELATRINVMMENLCSQVNGSSVLLRSGVDREMLNKWMREYNVGFTFTNGKAKNLVGESVDYSKGTDWLSSWKTAAVVDDPKVFIFKTQQAIEQATREKALFDEIGERFGSVNPGKGYRTKITGHPYLENYYFTSEIADQIPRVVKDWGPANWKSNSPLLRHYDRVLSMVKSGLTIYRPGHHVRNYVGDVYLGWMDGVNTLRPYQLAAQVQRSMRGAYKTLADVDELIKLGAMPKSIGTPKPNQVIFRNRSGQAFTAEQIAAAAHQRGLLEHVNTLEDIIDMGMEGGKKSILDAKPFGGKVQGVARSVSELFSHNTRLAHFIDKVMKSRGSDLPKIFEEAANRSRKWHPTGLDLTDFEKKYMRRIMPFYSWMRKSLPLIIEGLVMNPGKAVIPAKAYDAMQEMAGIDVPGRHDPFPVDQMFPEWIREGGLGPVGLPDGLLGPFSNQEPPGYAMAGMGLNPLTELVSQLQNPGKTIASSLTPAVQIPMELLTGKKTFTGEPIHGMEAREGAFEQWVGEQIPIWSAVQGVTGVTPFGTETGKKEKSGTDAGTEAFMNWLTGAGIRGTGPYIKQARYEKRQPAVMQKREAKEDFLRMLKEQQ